MELKGRHRLTFLVLVTSALLGLVGCSSLSMKEKEQLLTMAQNKQYDQALTFLESNDSYKKEVNALLASFEKGMLLHLKGDYLESFHAFSKGLDISQEWFTKSVTKAAGKWIVNDNVDRYYGEIFEISMAHYYQVLNCYFLYQQNPQQKDWLFKSRAIIVSWYEYLREMKEKTLGESVFKRDLMQTLLGNLIHMEVDSSSDRQIAQSLAKESQDLLFKHYSGYATFNNKYQDFQKNYSQFKDFKESEIKENFLGPTSHYDRLSSFLKDTVKTKPTPKGKTKFSILVENGWIPPKFPQQVRFGLGSIFETKDGNWSSFDKAIFYNFAGNVLGFSTPNSMGYDSNPALTTVMGAAAVDALTIEFELPSLLANPVTPHYFFVKVLPSGEVTPLPLVNPVGELAQETMAHKAAGLYARTGTRMGIKFLTAIAGAYLAYEAAGGSSGSMSTLAAMGTFYAAKKGIEASEIADIRQFRLLPDSLFFGKVEASCQTGCQLVLIKSSTPDYSPSSVLEEQILETITQESGEIGKKSPPIPRHRLIRHRLI